MEIAAMEGIDAQIAFQTCAEAILKAKRRCL
jgi:hypothetical protein